MDVSKATATSASAIVSGPQPQPHAPKNDKQPEKQQDSAVVKLSKQAQQMNHTENQNNNTERAKTRPQEVGVSPGIQFMQGEHKGGHVNTFA